MMKICKTCKQSVIAHQKDCAWLNKKLNLVRGDIAKMLFHQLTNQEYVSRETSRFRNDQIRGSK
jgi:hypothetical protein